MHFIETNSDLDVRLAGLVFSIAYFSINFKIGKIPFMKYAFVLLLMGVLNWFTACQTNKEQSDDEKSAGTSVQKEDSLIKPNVVVIYADDLGYGDLSSYGAGDIETPNVDQLAAEGLRFTNAHSTASTCTPSRYSMMTGDYAFRQENAHILPGNAAMLVPQDRATLGTIFQDAGYKTAIVGKWHIGLGPEDGPNWNGKVKPGPNEVGFDYSFIFPATADRVPTVFLENHEVIALKENDPIKVSYDHKVGEEPTGKENPELLKMQASHGHDGTIVNGIGRIGWMTGGKLARWRDEELAGDFLAKAQTFIKKNKDDPFFLYYNLNEPHVPRMPNTRFKGKSKLGYRGDVILEMDAMVGRLMETLDNLGLKENTMVVFTSDNGPVLNDGYKDESAELAEKYDYNPSGKFRGGKYSMFEGGTRLPLIVKWPRVVETGESDALVSQVDLLSSFADLLDVDLDKEDAVDSKNIMDVLLGDSRKGRNTYIEQNNSGVLSYIKDGWKYIEPAEGPSVNADVGIETGLNDEPQLYNLNKDVEEQHNKASDQPDKVKEMAQELKEIKESERTRH